MICVGFRVVQQIAPNLGMRVLADVLLIISVSGYQEFLSVRTMTYCSVKSGHKNPGG